MSTVAWVLECLWRFALAFLVGAFVYWLGVRHGLQHREVCIPPRPTLCPWCGGGLRSVLVWSSVCRVCDRGQVGPFATDSRTGWKEAEAPPFVSHVDVAAERDIEIRCHEW
jgi:hypothetical protein